MRSTWCTGWERRDGHPSWWRRHVTWWSRPRTSHERWGSLHTRGRRRAAGWNERLLHFEMELQEELRGQKWCHVKYVKGFYCNNHSWIWAKLLIIHLFSFSVPVGPETVFCFINFSARNLRNKEVHIRIMQHLLVRSTTVEWLLLTLKAIVSYGSAAISKYCQRRSGGSMRCSYADMKRCLGPIPSAISG